MKLLVVRHAIAENREDFAEGDDAARPLTPDGRKKIQRGAEGLKELVPQIDRLISSSLKERQRLAVCRRKRPAGKRDCASEEFNK